MPSHQNQRILVTGCCGTIGQELVRQLVDDNAGQVIAFDNNESDLFTLETQFSRCSNFQVSMGDVRDRDRLIEATRGVDVVFHLAAYKHVIMCERSPFDAVQTNIHGVQNIIQAARENHVGHVIFTSSDKAVNPTNVMGTSKLMGERLMTAGCAHAADGPVFASTRFGNVLGSRGSVVPIFIEQIRNGGPVTLTHPDMTRFIMSTSHAARLVRNSLKLARGGEVYLATAMVELLAPEFGHAPESIEIVQIGSKPGEKMYEELMSEEETRRAYELGEFFVVLPAFRDLFKHVNYVYDDTTTNNVDRPYISSREPAMTVAEIKTFLTDNNLLASPFLNCGTPGQ